MSTGAQPAPPDGATDSAFDVVVVGSGAAGMTAGLTAALHGFETLVIEKSSRFGGSTARSGGGVWIPNNEVLDRSGTADDADAAATYLGHIVGDGSAAEHQRAFLENGPRMLSTILPRTPLRMRWVPGYPDYYPESPGGRPRGRSIEPAPLDGRVLGQRLRELERDYTRTPPNFAITQADFRWLNLLVRHPRGALRAVRVGLRWLTASVARKRLLARGQALAAGLRAGLDRAGVPLWLDTRMLDLEQDVDGRITGVHVERAGQRTRVRARRGVVLTAGGFERNAEMRQQHQRPPIGADWTAGAKANTGDAILAAQRCGASVALMDDAWWGPSIPLSGGAWFCLAERTLPGCLMVNGEGQRFVNEAAPYIDTVRAMYGPGSGPAVNMPTWLIMDQRYRDRYVFAGLTPRQGMPSRWYDAGAVFRGDTLQELADRIGVAGENLAHTVSRFNEHARSGADSDYRRGESAYDRYYGDPRNKPNPCLGELRKPPFYAARIVPGDLGTKGGLRTDADARVLRADDTAIPGLYSAGNSSAPIMGRTYAGPGATLGPAMTFAHLAVRHIATTHQHDPSAVET